MGNVAWDSWVPGVLNPEQMKTLCRLNHIDVGNNAVHLDSIIDNSSIDLHLTGDAYRVTEGSVKPFGDNYLRRIREEGLVDSVEPDVNGSGIFTLRPSQTYVFKLRERLRCLCGANFYGQATAKSSVGRVDVLARLIVDGMTHYEEFQPSILDAGYVNMYLEVTPITFPVRVKKGTSLSQLRIFYGRPEDCELKGTEVFRTCFEVADGVKSDNTLSVDLTPDTVSEQNPVAFVANREEQADREPIDLWGEDRANPKEYWRFEVGNGTDRLKIRTTEFYILRSKERIALPGGVAVYARAIDEAIGEMRIHYAGFAHPHFGYHRSDSQVGTPLIFEVRGHNVDVNLLDGETMARLRFFRMSEDVAEDDDDSEESEECKEEEKSRYDDQTLQLSKFFAAWPREVEIDESGRVLG